MTMVDWLALLFHILLPAVITFGIIFGSWRLLAFLRQVFAKIVRKIDGFE